MNMLDEYTFVHSKTHLQDTYKRNIKGKAYFSYSTLDLLDLQFNQQDVYFPK